MSTRSTTLPLEPVTATDSRLWLLAAAGVNLTALYAAAAARLALPRYFPGGGVTIDFKDMLGPNWQRNSVLYTGFILLTFTLYGIALAAVWRRPRAVVPAWLLFGFPLLFVPALMLMYPPTAVDMFHYQADARTFWIHNQNPLVVPPSANPYLVAQSWADMPSPYGPLWSLLTFAPALLAGEHYVAGLLGFKLLAGAFYLGSAWLLWRLVARVQPGWQTVAVVLFAWNPWIALRTLGNGHNDIVMMFFVLLALERTERRDWLLAFPALALSVLVKFATALLVPMLLWYAWHHIPGTMRQRARTLLPGVAGALVVTVLCYAPFWQGWQTFDTLREQANSGALMITSTPDLLRTRLLIDNAPTTTLSADEFARQAADTARRITRGIFLLLYLPLLWQCRRDFPRLVTCSFHALFFYLIIAGAWFRPWYLLWPVTLAAIYPRSWLTALLVTITLFASFPDLIEQYRNNVPYFNDYWRAVAAPVMVFIWPTLLVWYFGVLSNRSWHFDVPRRAVIAAVALPGEVCEGAPPAAGVAAHSGQAGSARAVPTIGERR